MVDKNVASLNSISYQFSVKYQQKLAGNYFFIIKQGQLFIIQDSTNSKAKLFIDTGLTLRSEYFICNYCCEPGHFNTQSPGSEPLVPSPPLKLICLGLLGTAFYFVIRNWLNSVTMYFYVSEKYVLFITRSDKLFL